MTLVEGLMLAAVVILVLLPPRYDPAIRLKEWMMRRAMTKDEQ